MLKVNLKLSLLQTQPTYNLKFFRCLKVGNIASKYPNKGVMILNTINRYSLKMTDLIMMSHL
jgi:hypothetical protein